MIRSRMVASVVALALGLVLVAAVAAFAQGTSTIETASNATYGTILTNSQGMTLYYRTNDPVGGSTCTGACAKAWPALTVTGTPSAVSAVTGTLSTFTNPAGQTQVAYNGHALYTFVGDSAPGDTKGEGVANVWHVATVSLAAATSTPAASTSATSSASSTLPKTGSDPLAYLGGLLLIAGGLTLVLRRPARRNG
jgi:LPXTG-motif cell wall-anchored protein